MRLFFINNDGGGFADTIEVADGTSITQLFEQRLPHGKPADYLIRVNRQPVAADEFYVVDSPRAQSLRLVPDSSRF